MESSWQMKCGSTLQSSTPLVASSTSQEHQNQVEMSSGPNFYPNFAQDLRSTVHGRMPDHLFASSLNASSSGSGHVEPGNSFLALLSGPPSLLQCDFQDLSNPKELITSRKLSVNNSGIPIDGVVTGVPLMSSGILSENPSNQNLQHGANLCPAVFSREVVSSNCRSNSVWTNGLQPTNFNFQSLDLAKAVIRQILPGNDKVKDFGSLQEERFGASSANPGKLFGTTSQVSGKLPLESASSVSDQSSNFMSSCPRVFCLNTSGYLLLSNTGLLGIVCSCHFLHMSVSRFCEHSGFLGVNPGDAVWMDSGETIAQWRKLYFQKFGIRVLEDQSGWNWPDGLSAAAGSVKSGAAMTNRCDFSDLEKPVGFSGGLLRSAQPEDNTVSSKLAPMDQIIEAVHNKQQRISKECNNFHPKGLISTSQSNLLASVENQIIEWPVSRFSTVSKFVCRGLDNVPQSASAYVNSIVKAGNLSVSHSTCQNSRIPSNDDSRIESAKDAVITESDAGSSNVELKLGQPYQHNQPAGNLAPSVVRPKHLDTFVDPPKSFYLEQMIHNAPNYGEKGETRQQFFCAPGTSISTAVREVNQLNLGNRALGIRNFTDVTNGSVAPRVMHYNMPPERYANCNATTNLVSISEHVIPKSLHSESHTARSGPVNVPCNDGNVPQRQFDIPDLDFFRLTDMGKGVGCAADGSSAMAASAFKSQKQMQSYCSIGGGNLDASFTAVHDKTFFCTPQTSSMQADVFDNRCLFNYPGKVPSLGGRGHADLVSFRSTGPPAGSGKILQPQTVSMGLPSATKISIPGLIPALSGQECPGESSCLLDDNMRLLALRQILELSKQHNAISSFGMNQEPGKFGSASTGKGQQSLIDLSAAGEQRCAPDLTSKLNVSEVAVTLLPSGAGSSTSDPNKSAHVRGFSDWYNISTLAQGVPSCSLESHMPAQCSLNPLLDKQAKLRLGRHENLDQKSDHEKYCQRIPCAFFHGNSSCAAHAKCSGGNCEPRAGLSAISLKQQLGSVNCEASVLIASQSAKDHIVPKERTSLLDQMGKLQRRLPTGIVCHESRWRDVPSKHKRACDVKFMNQSADVLHGRAHDELQLRDPATKPLNESAQISNALKEQEMSNISSGCSAPAVTEASIEVNNVDSSTAHAGHLGYAGDAIVDEGSGIDKCWSSDDTLESEKSAELLSATCETSMRQEGSAKVISNQSSRTLLDELKLINSLTWKKGQSHIHSGLPVHRKTNHFKKTERHLKTGKRRREMKLKMLDESSVPVCLVAHDSCLKASHTLEQPSCSSKDKQMLLPSGLELYATGASSVRSSSGHGKSTFSLPLAKAVSRKRELHRLYDDRDGRDDYNSVSNSNANSLKLLEDSGRKKLRRVHTTDSFGKVGMQEQMHEDTEETAEYNLVGSVEPSSRQQVNACYRKARPIVCGEYGEISSGKLAGDVSRPVKFVSLSRVLKRSIRCTLPKDCKSKLPSIRELKKRRFGGRDLCFNGLSNWKKEEEEESHDILFCLEMNPDQFMEVATGNKQFTNDLSTIEREKADERQKNSSILDGTARAESRPKHKETRKRSLYELALTGRNSSSERSSLVKISKCMPKVKVGKSSKNADSSKCCEPRSFKINAEKSVQEKRFMSGNDRDAFCCVCGSSNNDEFNCLLECSHCIIRVHQACYGVSKVPKGSWYCRPCRTSSKDIVCVLCGYGGGAMTRALRSRTVVKSLLKARNIDTECSAKNPTFSAENFQDDVKLVLPPGSVFEDDSFQVPSPANTEQNMGVVKDSHCCLSNLKIHNSITAGAIDSTVKQWVHMVCGLWTPGTRCPNVDTMSAFDVSGASRAKSNEVCSMCNRPGGSCIQCRVMNCTVQFHPWCAHQKGLLQSEVEGVDNENVGFYGRCCLHATHPACESGNDTMETKMGCQGENQSTCARTEGYKGRKRDGFWHNLYGESRGKGGCFVPQEQLNAWIHINGQKSCIQGIPKLPTSIEYDCRKEYARYKQAKGWKHLVVYKSGIHALGLYTSRFISRGEMVVEYVGEVVGLRVADKREVEYQTGRKLQYKSACYFFRIDKEHIIDATLKGGIARFVNHSCLPNCVAKVISARNEKKVVFFAERDIYPGEEITYDYHFNHEDEGKKIPCFCNSKNCRRYLN